MYKQYEHIQAVNNTNKESINKSNIKGETIQTKERHGEKKKKSKDNKNI